MADPLPARELFADIPADAPLGVAVSGGGDSMALMVLALREGRRIEAATVDHGLRPESAAEAAAVADFCAARSVPHEVLRWEGHDGRGNLQAAAREARFALLGDWARRRGLAAVALGHTLDDQAETVLMRLARGSGVHGLSAMSPALRRGGMLWLRPLLGIRRAALRDLLRAEGIGWVEDPSNDAAEFDRVKARRALAALAPLGIDAGGLARTAARLGAAREVLDAEMARLAAAARRPGPVGGFHLDRAALAGALPETAMRLLADCLIRVAGRDYPPRRAALERLLAAVIAGEAGALHGCLIRPGAETLILREPAAAAPPAAYDPAGTVWDGRFRIAGGPPGEIGALGEEGLAALGDTAGWDAPRAAKLGAPALRAGARLLAVPHAGHGPALEIAALAHQELPEAPRGST